MREQAHLNLFGKPGHGAPTENIRKKRFTEYQLSEAENADMMEGSMDDSAVPMTRPTYRMMADLETNGNPYQPPEDHLMMTKHLSKSEPDLVSKLSANFAKISFEKSRNMPIKKQILIKIAPGATGTFVL